MLCQKCNNNEATTHIKRIINGRTAEYHLCSDCAASFGYGKAFSSPGFGELLSTLLGDLSVSRLSSRVLRCETCGSTFDDIIKNEKIGCPDCYRVFSDKLQPSVLKLHGQVKYCGKKPYTCTVKKDVERQPDGIQIKIDELKQQLNQAVAEQNFENAVLLRDEIRRLEALQNG